jgi:hypothetical protein
MRRCTPKEDQAVVDAINAARPTPCGFLKPGKRHLGRRNVELGFERQPADHGKTTGQIAGDAARARMHRCTGERDARKD